MMSSMSAHAGVSKGGLASKSNRSIRSSSRRVLVVTAAKRSVVILPGLGNAAGDYERLGSILKTNYDLHVETAPVGRIDWARNAAGLLDKNYWTGTLSPRPTVDWYLERIATALDAARAAHPEAPVTLLAHSAGGWLGRLYMLEFGRECIDQFVSLGSPHLPPPEGVVDQTRGILRFMEANSPGAYHDDVEYVTIAGKYIQGAPLLGPGSISQRIVGAGYETVCGKSDVYGDGIVPIAAAHLEGALNITLDGVYHSPLGAIADEDDVSVALSSTGADNEGDAVGKYMEDVSGFDSDEYDVSLGDRERAAQDASPGPRVWYGSSSVVPQWIEVITARTSSDTVAA